MRITFTSVCFMILLSITISLNAMERTARSSVSEKERAAQQALASLSLASKNLESSDMVELWQYLTIAIAANNASAVETILATKLTYIPSRTSAVYPFRFLSITDALNDDHPSTSQVLPETHPFMLALSGGNREIISAFFAHGLLPNSTCLKQGFKKALNERKLELVEQLSPHKFAHFHYSHKSASEPSVTSYFGDACRMQFFDAFPLLLSYASPSERSKLFNQDTLDWCQDHTKLDYTEDFAQYAQIAAEDFAQIMEQLISKKLITPQELEKVFLYQVRRGEVQQARFLLGHGVSIKGDAAQKAVIRAVYKKKKDILLMLLEGFEIVTFNCADIINSFENFQDRYQRSSIKSSELIELIEWLLEQGAFFMNDDCECQLPALAATPDGLPLIRFLVSKGVDIKGTKGSEALIRAAAARQAETVKFLVSNGVPLQGDTGQAILAHFCDLDYQQANTQEMIDFLIANGVDCKGTAGKKGLIKAIESGNGTAFDRLLFHEAGTQSERVGEVLAVAIKLYSANDYFIDRLIGPDREMEEALQLLLPHARLPARSPYETDRPFSKVLQQRLLSTIKKGKPIERALLESAEAAINPEEKNDDWKQKGRVMGALNPAKNGLNYKAADRLKEKFRFRGELLKTAIESKNKQVLNVVVSSLTPWLWIHKESQEYDFDLDQALQAGLDVNSILENGSPLLHELIGDPSKFKRLLAVVSNVNTVDSSGQTVLHKFCGIDIEHMDMMSLAALLQTPILVNAQDQQGTTALHIAAQTKMTDEQHRQYLHDIQKASDLFNKHRQIILALLEKKADTSLQDRNGHSVLHLYVQAQGKALQELLKDIHGNTGDSLKALANKACLDLIDLLLRRGADPRQKNVLGHTVMDILPLTNFPTQEARLLLKATEKELNEHYTKIIQNSKNVVILILLIAIAYYQLHQSGII